MKILLIKLSSIGDLLHVFPALTALQKTDPQLEISWVVESSFKEVPTWHPAVKHVIAVPIREFKQAGLSWASLRKLHCFCKLLRQEKYDYIIDAQGLFKSAWIAKIARGKTIGFAKNSGRESVWWLYDQRIFAAWDWHAIERVQALFNALQANKIDSPSAMSVHETDYGLKQWQPTKNKILLFVHGTTWVSKHYPDHLWLELVKLSTAAGYTVWLAHSNQRELERATFLKSNEHVVILPAMTLTALKDQLHHISGMIAVDTGLAHIAASLGIPTVTLYGPTDPALIGTRGHNQIHFATDPQLFPRDRDRKTPFSGFATLAPEVIFAKLLAIMHKNTLI